MPSLGDVANEVKALLEDVKTNTIAINTDTDAIKNDTSAIKADTNTIINQLNGLDADMKSGFTNLAQGLQILIALGMQMSQLLAENNDQNRTIICWLTNIANTLCDVKHNTDHEVALQTSICATLHHMDDIGELVNAREAMEVAKLCKIEDRMNKCCPPKTEPVPPCFEPCASPRPVRFEPVKIDWTPIKYSGRDNKPIG